MRAVMPDMVRRCLLGPVQRSVLGVTVDPETWPEPSDVATLPVAAGIAHPNPIGPAWSMADEFRDGWVRHRTVIGAQAYRFAVNGEYDCGWRLVDAAARFLRSQVTESRIDAVAIIPPPPVHHSVAVLPWAATRLALRLAAAYTEKLLVPVAPYGEHPDTARHLPVPLGELFTIDASLIRPDMQILLADWRWHRGRTLTAVGVKLREMGVRVIHFTWLG
jgi:hypothetical protein